MGSWGGARAAVDDWLRLHGWRQQAWDAGAFDKRTRSFHVLKADPFDERRPFARLRMDWTPGAVKYPMCSWLPFCCVCCP